MSIDMNWAEVSSVASNIREQTEVVVSRLNAGLEDVGSTAAETTGLHTSAALMSCQDAWARELGDLVRRTMIAADKLDDSAMSTEQAETENTLAAQALQGLL